MAKPAELGSNRTLRDAAAFEFAAFALEAAGQGGDRDDGLPRRPRFGRD
jgi:hypothetical protein